MCSFYYSLLLEHIKSRYLRHENIYFFEPFTHDLHTVHTSELQKLEYGCNLVVIQKIEDFTETRNPLYNFKVNEKVDFFF